MDLLLYVRPFLHTAQNQFPGFAGISFRLRIILHDFVDGMEKAVMVLHILKLLEKILAGQSTYSQIFATLLNLCE
jgi:hypothetical protein